MRWAKRLPIHPILFSIYPVLALFAANYNTVTFAETWRALIIAGAAAGGALLLLGWLFRAWQRVAIVVSVSAILFFSYGHIILALARASQAQPLWVRPEIVTLLWPVAWIVLAWAAARPLRDPEPVSVFMNISSAILILLTGSQLILFTGKGILTRPTQVFDPAEIPPAADRPLSRPDIYYIILDGYAREDVLRAAIGYDNRVFLMELEGLGFTVAQSSTANYSNTTPSIASSLNMGYINALSDSMDTGSMDYRPLRRLIEDNRVSAFLKGQGYTTAAFESGFNFTENHAADHFIPLEGGPNYFESLLLTNSLSILWSSGSFSERYRGRINTAFDRLPALADIPPPKFVFAHIMAAHPPFVFGPDGEVADQAGSVTLDSGDEATRQREIEGYRGQVQYINRRVLEMVRQIIASSAEEPVIILQGDHGSGVYMDWQSAERTCFHERMAILNAVYLPGGKSGNLYDTITPVNTFRVVLNAYFDAGLPLLADRNYFSLWESPYHLVDVTGQAGACPESLR